MSLVGSFILVAEVAAVTYYVSPTGLDSNTGLANAPFNTIQKAVNSVSPGDTIIVRNGNYTTTNPRLVDINVGGTASNWITIKSENKWGAVLDGQNNTTNGGLLLQAGAQYIRIEGFEIKGFFGYGVSVGNNTAANNIYFYRNKIHDIGRQQITCTDFSVTYGKSAFFTGVGTSQITVDSNIFYNIGRFPGGCIDNDYNKDQTIYIKASNVTIVNNVLYNNLAGWNIALDGTADVPGGIENIIISNNTFYGKNPQRDGHIDTRFNVRNLTIQNNISHTPGAYFLENDTLNMTGFSITYGSNHSVYNNLVYGSGSVRLFNFTPTKNWTWSGNIENQDPQFVNLGAYDFHLKPASPAIDKGINSGLTIDSEGRQIAGMPDIGAFEYNGITVTDVTPPAKPGNLLVFSAPPPSSILANPGFESGTSPWVFYTNGTGSFNVDAAGNGSANAGHVVITTAGTNVQLYQANAILEPNTLYQLSFNAYSNTGHDLWIALNKHVSPYTNYGLGKVFDLTASWQKYTVQFTTTGFSNTVNDGRLLFLLSSYNASGDEYFFDDVVLTKL